MIEKKYYTYSEAAEYLGYKVSTLYSYVCEGKIEPSCKRGHFVRFTIEDLEKWARGNNEPSEEE